MVSALRIRTLRVLAPLLAAAALGAWAAPTSAAEGETNCSTAPNPVACENALPGAPASSWQVEKVGDPSIQGYATQMSVNAGETETFKIKTPATGYHIDILRLGYYHGDGARMIASGLKPSATLPQTQPECVHQAATGLIDCGNWEPSASWTVPSTAVSGVYIAHLVRDDQPEESTSEKSSQIIFVVRNDASHSKILVQTSDATWEAYNAYGGNSLYTCTVECPTGNPKAYKAAYAVSYNRPFDGALTTDNGASYLYYAEYQMIRFLEKNGYDVSYTASGQVDQNGALLRNHQIFMSSGHDEYWSAGQRTNVEAAREAGVNLAFFSANELFWKTRWGNSIDGSATPYRTLTTYKETHFEGPTDPSDPSIWTGSWRDPRGGPSADGGKPENALSGQQFEVNSGSGEMTVPSNYSRLRLWRNTAVAGLSAGQTLTIGPNIGTLGYEWDEDVDNGFRPAGEFQLSSTTLTGVQVFTDYGSSLNGNATATHHLTLYRAPSGALVFGAGTVQWSWGLDNTNAWNQGATDPEHPPADPNMQQFTVNLLAEMGAQPETLSSNLASASPTTDNTAPTSTITSPSSGETVQDGGQVSVSGTATDTGGGVVAGVEVSTDNGATWHPATLSGQAETSVSWSYTWAAHGYPQTTIKSRAVDDSANLETPSAGVQVKVACPCSLWGGAVTPPIADSGDAHAVELGMKFTTETFGLITGVRYYKSVGNTGTHTGSLWSSTGQRLATATFGGESGSGWQQVTFSNPVDVFPGQTYVVSYFTPTGHYAASPYYFYTPPATGGNALGATPLHALPANGQPVNGSYTSLNGVYAYGSTSAFPANSFAGSNYWVDPVFTPVSAPEQPANVTATAGYESASVTWTAPGSGGPVTTYTITPYVGAEPQPPTTITGTPPATGVTIGNLLGGVTYTFKVTASNPIGAGPVSAASNGVTPTANSTPTAPTGVTAAAATSRALVSWVEPASNGGSPITGYTITPYLGTVAQTPVETNATATSATIKNLANGSAYTFTVTANNAIGAGPASTQTAAVTPQDTIFDFSTPATLDSGDASSTNVGVKFTSELAGTVTGIRFYKAAANTGTHIGSLWSSTGTLLAQATFTNETASGWQQVNFASPVTIAANTTYVASYLAPKGHYSNTSSAFASTGFANPPLSALANTTSADGVYAYNSKSTFPASTFKSTNYWVDVDFEPTQAPGQVTNVTGTPGNGSVSLTWSAPVGGGPVTSYTITPFIAGEPQAPTTLTGSPPATNTTIKGLINGLAYTFSVQASNANGNGPVSARSAAITPATVPSAPAGVAATAGPGSATVKWSTPANGGSAITKYTITPYIGTEAQTPTTITGTPPATETTITGLTNGSTYTFTVTAANSVGTGPASEASNPVMPTGAPSAPTSVSASAGNASATVKWTAPSSNGGNAITSYTVTPFIGSSAQSSTTVNGTPPATSATITGLTNGTAYTFKVTATNSVGTSPSSEASGSVTPTAVNPPSAPTGVIASAATSQALVSWAAPANNGGSAITGYRITPFVGGSAQGTVETGTGTTSAIVTGLTNGTPYTFSVTAVNAVGAGPASAASAAITPQDTIFDFATPATIDSTDAHSVVLGMKFTSEVGGSVTGVRFYKASTNTGTHVASLWTSGGTLLATATFSGETASGWQQVYFSTPVAISANTTYVVGYLAPKGHYSDTSSGFASSSFTNAPLAALANSVSANGVYVYSSTSAFPTNTFKATNYWVDVDFAPGP